MRLRITNSVTHLTSSLLFHLQKRRKLFSTLCALWFCLLGQGLLAQPMLFTNARIIVGDGSVIEQGAMLVDGESIVAIGDAGELSSAENGTTFDLSGKTLIPGLIDAHAHLGYQGRNGWGAENYTQENLIDNLQQYAYYGFAAVFSAGSDAPGLAIEVQSRLALQQFQGARLLYAAGMAPPGQGPNNQFLDQALAVEKSTGANILWGLENPEQARAAVREVAAQDFEFIKLWVDDRGGSQQKLAPSLYEAVIEAARSAGLRVFIHQQFAEDMPDLITAGAHGFLHGRIGSSLNAAIAEQLSQSNVFVIPNLGLGELRSEAIGADRFLGQVLSSELRSQLLLGANRRELSVSRSPQLEAEQRESFAALIDAGVDIVLGTDAGAIPNHHFGYTGHRELEIFVRLGMSPMQALQAATSKAANHLQLDDLGLLQSGYSADFVILDANPLEDIRNTRSIMDVYLKGKPVDRAVLQQQWQGQ